MYYQKILPTTLLFLLIGCSLLAQDGDFFIANYAPDSRSIDNVNYGIAQDNRGQMCFANRRGVLKFDGAQWFLISTPSTAYAIEFDTASNNLYVGCRDSFGYIHTEETGKEHYAPLSDPEKKNMGEVVQIELFGNKVFFLSDSGLYSYDKQEKKIADFWPDWQGEKIFALVNKGDDIWAFTASGQMYSILSGKNEPLPIEIPAGSFPMFTHRLASKKVLIGLSNNRLYHYNNGQLKPIELKDQAYLDEAELLDAVPLPGNKLLIATQKGGALKISLENGETLGYINYQTGLPDDEVFAMSLDRSGAVWVAHELGLSRIDFSVPLRRFSNFPGLEGKPLAALELDGALYVGTSQGLFMLDEVKDYEEVEKFVRRRVMEENQKHEESEEEKSGPIGFLSKIFGKKDKDKASEDSPEGVDEPVEAEREDDKEKKKGKFKLKNLFKFGKSKDDDGEEGGEEASSANEDSASEESQQQDTPSKKEKKSKGKQQATPPPATAKASKPQTKYYYVKRTELSLKSIKYVFRKVEGVSGKCSQLLVWNGKLLAATNLGLFAVNGTDTETVSNRSIDYLYYAEKNEALVASTEQGEILKFSYEKKRWKSSTIFSEPGSYISHIIEDSKGFLWLAGSNQLFKLKIGEDGQLSDATIYPIKNPYSDVVSLINYSGKIYAIFSDGFYFPDPDGTLVEDKALEKRMGFRGLFLNSQQGIIWIYDGDTWTLLSERPMEGGQLAWLRLFSNIDEIFLSDDRHYAWIFSGDGGLYRFNIKESDNIGLDYEVFLRNVTDHEGKLLELDGFSLSQQKSKITFNVVKPTYIDNGDIEYQYWLGRKGITKKEWSAWQKDSDITFNYLQSGKYNFQIRAKSGFGEIIESRVINFTIQPPWWERPWFYAAEVVFFSSLLLLSFRLNRTKRRNRFITKGLTYLTLILFISLIEVVAESFIAIDSNPVFDFAAQAMLAMLIFPFERMLRLFMTKSAHEG